MTAPMTDERLDELREADSSGHLRMVETSCVYESGNVLVSDVDFRSLLARLDAAEELIREVARCREEPFKPGIDSWRWVQVGVGRDAFARCKAYLPKEAT